MNVAVRLLAADEVIALFPDQDETNGMILSYMYIGQHSAAHPDLINELPKASEAETTAMLKHLNEMIGYEKFKEVL